MMLEKITGILKASGVYAWEVSDVKKQGWEFYFIRHALDQHRAKNVEHINVKVYQFTDDGQSLGFASAELAPTATDAEAEKLVNDLAYRATLVKNRPYALNVPAGEMPGTGAPSDLAAISGDFIRTMAELRETESEDVNSYEIFVSDGQRPPGRPRDRGLPQLQERHLRRAGAQAGSRTGHAVRARPPAGGAHAPHRAV